MDAVDIARVLIRRWYVTLWGIVLVVYAVSAISSRIDPTYESTTDVLMLTPGVSTTDPDYLNARHFFNNAVALGNAGISLARSDQMQSELREKGYSTDFTVTGDREGSIYEIAVESSTPENARESVGAVVEVFRSSIAQVQAEADVPEQLYMELQQIRQPSAGIELTGDRTKVQAAVAGVGIVIVIIAAMSVNALIEARARRRRRAAAIDEESIELMAASGDLWRPASPEPPRRWGT